MSVNQPFEFPQELRELTEKNVEQPRATYGQFMDAMMQGAVIWIGVLMTEVAQSMRPKS